MITLSELLDTKGKEAVTVNPDSSVAEAIRTMHQCRVGSVIVTVNDGVPLGILTERDVLRLYAEGHRNFETLLVKDCMTTRLVFGRLEDEVQDVLAIMTERRFRHLPVMRGQHIAGVVSIGDLVKAQLHETAVEAQALREYIHS